MTAPGNSSLLLTLLAALIASTGYAGGRIHQWYRMGRDRDEAFRDGYDTATRSVFSLAARVISPRRADRAAIRASAGVVLPAESVVSSVIPIDVATGSRSADRAARSASPADGRAVRFPSRSADRSGTAAAERDVRAVPAAKRDAPFGSLAGEQTAPVVPVVPAGAEEATESSGRHTVPDELVHAATYRLPPDRVARAKVHEPGSPPVVPTPDGKPRVAVPKPRTS
jgi:hypothetical protein